MAEGTPDAAKLFVSYASGDRTLVARVVDFLREQAWDVWWDRQLQVGAPYDRGIEAELDAADCVVVVWSRESVASNWVLSEAMVGFERNRLVPVALDARLAIPLPFNRVHAASLADWAGEPDHPGLEELAEGIRSTLASRKLRGASQEASEQRKPVLAVLPFDDLDAPGAARPLCATVASALIAALGRFSALDTLSRRASFNPALGTQEIRGVARELRADYLVTGSLSGTGASTLLSVELIEGRTGRQTWSTALSAGEPGAIDAAAAAGDIARALSGEFLRLLREGAQDGSREDSWSLVAAGRHTLLQSTGSAIALAKHQAERALQLAPENGQAHALLASALAEELVNGYSPDIEDTRTRALRAVEQALIFCADDPEVLKYAGHIFAVCGEHDQGELVLRRALELNLYDQGAHGYLGWLLAPSTTPEHLDEIDLLLDRLLAGTEKHPGRPFWLLHRAVSLTCRGDFEGALATASEVVHFSPYLVLAWLHAINALGQLDRCDEARDLIERCPLSLEDRGAPWEATLRLISRDADAAALRTGGLKRVGLR